MTTAQQSDDQFLRVRVGCDFLYDSDYPTPMMVLVRPRDRHDHLLLDEQRWVDPLVPIDTYYDTFGNQIWRFVAPVGRLHLRYDALVDVPYWPDRILADLPRTQIEDLPYDTIVYTLPSRYCQPDLLADEAWRLFGHIPGGWQQVQAVCDWIHTNIEYGKGSTATTTSYDVYQAGRGVCRDFAHMGVTLCRALNYPARYVCGYLPDINVPPDPTPMDFHAWFEVFLDGAWYTFDARHNRPRTGRALIGIGRDAVDVALATIYGGTRLASMTVWADQVDRQWQLDHNLPANDVNHCSAGTRTEDIEDSAAS